jgi:drug/metabolite transporter (DMT)-like permease
MAVFWLRAAPPLRTKKGPRLQHRKNLINGYLAAAATLVMWSCFSLISRLGAKSILTPYDIFALRLVTASLVLLPFARSMPRGWWRDLRLWRLAVLCSLLYCPLAYQGFKFAPASHGAILLSGMQPFLISAVVWLIAGTRPNRIRSVGLACIGIGIVCAAMPYFTHWSADSIFGDFLIFLSSVSWAFYAVLATRWGYSAWTQTRAVVFISVIVYLPIYLLWLPKEIASAPLAMILIQSSFQGIIATIVAMFTYLKALSLIGAERTSSFLALVPIVVGVCAVPLLNEALTPWLAAGVVFVSLGSYVASRYGTTPLKAGKPD